MVLGKVIDNLDPVWDYLDHDPTFNKDRVRIRLKDMIRSRPYFCFDETTQDLEQNIFKYVLQHPSRWFYETQK
mgnify:CR=1 FL=1